MNWQARNCVGVLLMVTKATGNNAAVKKDLLDLGRLLHQIRSDFSQPWVRLIFVSLSI